MSSDLPQTKFGNTQLLVLVEAVSGFPECYPLKRRTVKEVSKALLDHRSRFGVPLRLRVDQGGEFEGEVKELCQRYGVFLKVIFSHHPQSNGQIERRNMGVKERLITSGAEDTWDLDIARVLRGIRWTPSRRTGRSPHEVLFGEQPRIPFTTEEQEFNDAEDIVNMVNLNGIRSRELAEAVRQSLQRYESSTEEIKKGMLVWVRNFGRKKLEPKWVWPSAGLGNNILQFIG